MSAVVAESLRLRRWVIAFLTHVVDRAAFAQSWPGVSLDAWRFFLAAEVIAWPLGRRLGSASSLLPADVRRILDDATRPELQRIMAARSQLTVIDSLGAASGIAPILLKGGLSLTHANGGFDLGDIDLLMPDLDRKTMVSALCASGYTRNAAGDTCRIDGGLPIELHTTLTVGYNEEEVFHGEGDAIDGFRALRRLPVATHLFHLIRHSTTAHALRRGHLRDALLIAAALDNSSAAERLELEALVATSRRAELYGATYDFAQAMTDFSERPAEVHDPFTRNAAAKYAMLHWLKRGSPRAYPALMTHVPFLVASPGEATALAIAYVAQRDEAASRWHLPTLARYSPAMARVISTIVRTPVRIANLAGAFAIACAINALYATRWKKQSRTR